MDSYSLIEHFDFMKRSIPQPFSIKSDQFVSLESNDNTDEYEIKTSNGTFTVNNSVLKKLVDALGIKIKLLSSVSDSEADVYSLIMPILNKLLKCYLDCFVFYHTSDDPHSIIDINVNTEKGEEGTRYENGPSPWEQSVNNNPSWFTCFNSFFSRYGIQESDNSILVKADEIVQKNKTVVLSLFKNTAETMQPMLVFSGRFSNMDGFSEIHPALYDASHNITIMFPTNYSKKSDQPSFDEMWGSVMHISEDTDADDYIFKAINSLAVSDDTPTYLRNFIGDILSNSTININQPIGGILDDAAHLASSMKPTKKEKFLNKIGRLIGFAIFMKHRGCSECGHFHV